MPRTKKRSERQRIEADKARKRDQRTKDILQFGGTSTCATQVANSSGLHVTATYPEVKGFTADLTVETNASRRIKFGVTSTNRSVSSPDVISSATPEQTAKTIPTISAPAKSSASHGTVKNPKVKDVAQDNRAAGTSTSRGVNPLRKTTHSARGMEPIEKTYSVRGVNPLKKTTHSARGMKPLKKTHLVRGVNPLKKTTHSSRGMEPLKKTDSIHASASIDHGSDTYAECMVNRYLQSQKKLSVLNKRKPVRNIMTTKPCSSAERVREWRRKVANRKTEQERDTERRKQRRSDIEYRIQEQSYNTKRRKTARKDIHYREAEQSHDTKRRKAARTDLEYRQAEQFKRKAARREPLSRIREQNV